jgi:predicted amidophosphoribosyltransferase
LASVPDVFCSTCGAKNVGSTSNCMSCGKPLARVAV